MTSGGCVAAKHDNDSTSPINRRQKILIYKDFVKKKATYNRCHQSVFLKYNIAATQVKYIIIVIKVYLYLVFLFISAPNINMYISIILVSSPHSLYSAIVIKQHLKYKKNTKAISNGTNRTYEVLTGKNINNNNR